MIKIYFVLFFANSNFQTLKIMKSINKNLNLTSLIGENKEDYVNKAVSLAQNRQMLLNIRKDLFKNALKSPLFDQSKFSKDFFSSLEKIYN